MIYTEETKNVDRSEILTESEIKSLQNNKKEQAKVLTELAKEQVKRLREK